MTAFKYLSSFEQFFLPGHLFFIKASIIIMMIILIIISESDAIVSSLRQIELLTPHQNGTAVELEGSTRGGGAHRASIKGMWKKAFRSLKSHSKDKDDQPAENRTDDRKHVQRTVSGSHLYLEISTSSASCFPFVGVGGEARQLSLCCTATFLIFPIYCFMYLTLILFISILIL